MRGTSDSNLRGSSYDRRRRREYIISEFGSGGRLPCYHCGKKMRATPRKVELQRISYRTGRPYNETLFVYTWEVDRYPLCGHSKHLSCGPKGGRYLIGREKMTQERRRALMEELRALIQKSNPTRFELVKAKALMWRVGNIVPSCRACNNTRCTTAKRCRGNALNRA